MVSKKVLPGIPIVFNELVGVLHDVKNGLVVVVSLPELCTTLPDDVLQGCQTISTTLSKIHTCVCDLQSTPPNSETIRGEVVRLGILLLAQIRTLLKTLSVHQDAIAKIVSELELSPDRDISPPLSEAVALLAGVLESSPSQTPLDLEATAIGAFRAALHRVPGLTNVTLHYAGYPDDLTATLARHPSAMRIAAEFVGNTVTNAVIHGVKGTTGGTIVVCAGIEGNQLTIVTQNSGKLLSDAQKEKILGIISSRGSASASSSGSTSSSGSATPSPQIGSRSPIRPTVPQKGSSSSLAKKGSQERVQSWGVGMQYLRRSIEEASGTLSIENKDVTGIMVELPLAR